MLHDYCADFKIKVCFYFVLNFKYNVVSFDKYSKHIHETRCPIFFFIVALNLITLTKIVAIWTCASKNISTSLYKFVLQIYSMLQA
jgi:hypothetical protein